MKINVLDHGYVEFIEAWGVGKDGIALYSLAPNETSPPAHYRMKDFERGIIEAARQSTQGSFRGWEGDKCYCGHDTDPDPKGHHEECAYRKNPGDARLLKFLYSNKHFTPFEFAGMVIEVQAPIFVFREWHRHRTQSYNEMSARYAPLPDLNYVPSVERIRTTSTENKQAGTLGDVRVAGLTTADLFIAALERQYQSAQILYEEALKEGVPKELARLVLPVGRYSKMRASANLRNWLAFLTLRCDPAAQWEIQQYAGVVAEIIEKTFPQTFKLWWDEL